MRGGCDDERHTYREQVPSFVSRIDRIVPSAKRKYFAAGIDRVCAKIHRHLVPIKPTASRGMPLTRAVCPLIAPPSCAPRRDQLSW
jgi:hypothetical protein